MGMKEDTMDVEMEVTDDEDEDSFKPPQVSTNSVTDNSVQN